MVVERDLIGRRIGVGCGGRLAARKVVLTQGKKEEEEEEWVEEVGKGKVMELVGNRVMNGDVEVLEGGKLYFVRVCSNRVCASPVSGIFPPHCLGSEEQEETSRLVWIKLVDDEAQTPIYFGSLEIECGATFSDLALYLETVLSPIANSQHEKAKLFLNSLDTQLDPNNMSTLQSGDQILICSESLRHSDENENTLK